MKKVSVFAFAVIVLALTVTFNYSKTNDPTKKINRANANSDKTNSKNEEIVWLGKGREWNYEIKLIHKPNDQVQFIGHGKEPLKPCVAPDYAVEMSEALIYTGNRGSQFTSLKEFYQESQFIINPINGITTGGPNGFISIGQRFGTSTVGCFSEKDWKYLKTDLSEVRTVSVSAYPLDNSAETITLRTASVPPAINFSGSM